MLCFFFCHVVYMLLLLRSFTEKLIYIEMACYINFSPNSIFFNQIYIDCYRRGANSPAFLFIFSDYLFILVFWVWSRLKKIKMVSFTRLVSLQICMLMISWIASFEHLRSLTEHRLKILSYSCQLFLKPLFRCLQCLWWSSSFWNSETASMVASSSAVAVT